jgi:hypothetical protein
MLAKSPVHVLIVAPGAGTAGRVPVLACADALRAGGATVEVTEPDSHQEITAALTKATEGEMRLVVPGVDGQVRAVVRQLVRRAQPRGGDRPPELASNRTIPDLPPIAILPLTPAGTDPSGDLVTELGLPSDPEQVAAAVLSGEHRRLDLLRHDGGSVTLRSALLGGVDDKGKPAPWTAAVHVDDTILSHGDEPLLAVGVTNTGPLDALPGLPLSTAATATDGVVTVGIAVPSVRGGRLRRRRPEIEVRRATGRAVAIIPTNASEEVEIPVVDDGVHGTVRRKRTWWVEPGAWAVYTGGS